MLIVFEATPDGRPYVVLIVILTLTLTFQSQNHNTFFVGYPKVIP